MREEFVLIDDSMYFDVPSVKDVMGEYNYPQYTGKKVSKIKITSTQPMYLCPRKGEVVKQALTIRSDGRVALTTFEAVGVKFKALDSRNFDYSEEETAKVLDAISAFFREKHAVEDAKDAGEWKILITDEDGVCFKTGGSLSGEDAFRKLSDSIRKILKMDLFLFDGGKGSINSIRSICNACATYPGGD